MALESDAADTASGEADLIVIGAGLAGTAVAAQAAARGDRVVVLDPAGPGGGASGHARAVVRPLVRIDASPATRLARAALRFGALDGAEAAPCGVLEPEPERLRLERRLAAARSSDGAGLGAEVVRLVERDEAEALVGADVGSAGLWLPGGTVIDAAARCRRRLDSSPRIVLRTAAAAAIEMTAAGVRIRAEDGRRLAAGARVVLAAGSGLAALLARLAGAGGAGGAAAATLLARAGLRPVRGQVVRVGTVASLRAVVARGGTVVPAADGGATGGPPAVELGATYDEHDGDPRPRGEDDARVLARFRDRMPVLARGLGLEADPVPALSRWAAVRVRTADRLPLAGTLPGTAGRIAIVGALGSHGGLLADVLAQIVVAGGGCETAADDDLAAAVAPGRFGSVRG